MSKVNVRSESDADTLTRDFTEASRALVKLWKCYKKADKGKTRYAGLIAKHEALIERAEAILATENGEG